MEDRLHLSWHRRKLRRQQHRTLQVVADRCGYCKSLLSKIENCRIVPPVATAVRIAEALGTTVTALIKGSRDVGTVCARADEAKQGTVQTLNGYSIFPFATQHRHKEDAAFSIRCPKG